MADQYKDEVRQTQSATGSAQRLTDKGQEYQTTIKLKIFKQMLGKLEKDDKILMDDLTTQDADEQTDQAMTVKISKWKHKYILLQQTNEDLRHLLGAEYELYKAAPRIMRSI